MTAAAAARPGTAPGGWPREYRTVHALAVFCAAWTFLLLAVGGMVTGKEAGLAVPDWPLSYGTVNPPLWWRSENVLLEHGHRLLGWGIGLYAILLAVALQFLDPRRWMRRLGWIAVAAVCVQGVLGGARVQWLLHYLAAVHGVTGQAFFCLMVALALFTSPSWRRDEALADERPALPALRRRALLALVAVYLQVVVGAILRHSRAGHEIAYVLPHILVGIVAAGLGIHAAVTAILGAADDGALRRPAVLLGVGLVVQVLLGFGTYFANVRGAGEIGRPAYQWVTGSAHQAMGALVLTTAMVLWLRARGLRRGAPAEAGRQEPAEPSARASLSRAAS